MSDYTGTLPPEWYEQYERATEAVKTYAAAEKIPASGTLHRLAMSAQQRSSPSQEDLKTVDWVHFFPDLRNGTEHEQQLWEEANEKRQRWNQMHRDVVARNAKAESDRVDAREAEVQAGRDADLAAVTEDFRRRHLQTPGATEATFAAALPGYLEDLRRRMVQEQTTADDIAMAAHRAAFKI